MVEDADKVSAEAADGVAPVPAPVEEPKEQPLTKAELTQIVDGKLTKAYEHFQRLKDREVLAERKARLDAETRLGNVEAQNRAFQTQYLESLSPEERLAFENKELRRRLDVLENRGTGIPTGRNSGGDTEPRHYTLDEVKEMMKSEVEAYGADVNDPKIDWALEDMEQGQRRFYASLAKIQKATHDKALKEETERVKVETKQKLEKEYNIGVVEVSGSSGHSGGLTPEHLKKMSPEERWAKKGEIDKLPLGID